MQTSQLRLSDGRTLSVEQGIYPLPSERWTSLIRFWQTEWARTEIDWLEALRGAYADTLTTEIASASLNGEVLGAALAHYPKAQPEVCCISDVLTSPTLRGLGIAAKLTDSVVEEAFAKGCRVSYLGNKPTPRTMYERIGFRRLRGAVMRRAAEGAEKSEADWYAKGQAVSVRDTVWGDLPGVACLLAQPLDWRFADYARGLVSIKYADPTRCVSNFTTVWNEVAQRGGKMLTLAGAPPSRVLGFGTLTPDPGAARSHLAMIEAVTHDHFHDAMSLIIAQLMAEARRRNLESVYAYVAESDASKRGYFEKAGFRPVSTLRNHVRLDNRPMDVSLLEIQVAK